MKFTNFLFTILIFLSSCSIFRSDEQNAIHAIDRHNRKLAMLYAAWPKYKPTQDSVSGQVNINNPIVKVDTLYQYTDTGTIRILDKLLFEKIRDTVYVNKIIKLFRDKKCIGDSLIIDEEFYKLKVTEDSLGMHFLITPKDTVLSKKYKQACPPVYCPEDKFYSHSEFWAVSLLLLTMVLGILIHLKLS